MVPYSIVGTDLQILSPFRPKNSVFLRNRVTDSDSDLGLHDKVLVSKIHIFARIIVTITIENYRNTIRGNTVQNPQYRQNSQYPQKKTNFDQGVHYRDVLVVIIHFPEGGKMQISLKL